MRRLSAVLAAIGITVIVVSAAACGSSGDESATPTAQPTSTPSAGGLPQPAPDDGLSEPATVAVLAPIDDLEIIIAESFPPQYFLRIVSGLPNACHKFNGYVVERAGKSIEVTVTNTMPAEVRACAEVYGMVETNVALGTDFESGESYTVSVNGVTESFEAQ